MGEKSTQIERNRKKMTKKEYFAAKPKVIVTSGSVLSPKSKDLISNKEKVAWFIRLNAVAQTVI